LWSCWQSDEGTEGYPEIYIAAASKPNVARLRQKSVARKKKEATKECAMK
jgi:hypothetical protein